MTQMQRTILKALVPLVGLLALVGAWPGPAGAAVISATNGVQTGTATIAAGATTTAAPVTINAVVPAQSILWFEVTHNQPSPADGSISGQITNGTTLTFQRQGTVGVITIRYHVAYFSSGVTVQRGAAPKNGAATTNVTIAAVNLAQSFVLISERRTGTTFDGSGFVRARLSTTTNLELTSVVAAAITQTVEWQVVQITAGASVQSGLTPFTTAQATVPQAITAVNLAASFLVFNYSSAAGTAANIGQKMVRGQITSTTGLTFDRASTGQAINVSWFVVSFTDGTTVQSGTANFTTAATTNPTPITLSPAVVLNRTVAFGGNVSHIGQGGGSTAYTADDNPGMASFTHALTTTTNLALTRGTSGATADVGWFVVQFNTVASAATSAVAAAPTSVVANGATTSTITVTLRDANNNPVAGKTVTVASSRGATDTLVQPAAVTDINGQTTGTVRSTTAGTSTLTATDTTDAVTVTPTAAVTFTAGAVSAATSTVAAAPTSVVANGATTSTLTITLRDAFNNPVAGKTVTLASSRGATDTLVQPAAVTNASGQTTGTVRSTTAGTSTLTATDTTDTLTVTQTAVVTFTAGAVSVTTSTVTASPMTVVADGATTSTITVTLRDTSNNPVSGKTVTLASSRGATDTLVQPAALTNASGQTTGTVRSTTVGPSTLTATDTTDTLTVTQTATVTFALGGVVSAATSTVTAAPTTVTADGVTTSTITVTLRDVSNNPVAGKTVTLASSRGATDTIVQPAAVTNASGQTTGTVRSTTAGTSTLTATDTTDTITVTQTATVTFTAGAVSATTSAVVASPTAVVADGTTTSTITITLRDANNNPVSGKTVTLASSRGATDTMVQPAAVTNASGQTTGTVRSTTVGTSTLTATDTTDAITLTPTATVTFAVGGAVSATTSTVVAVPTTLTADGVTTSTITITLRDVNNIPIAGKTVTLASSRGTTDTLVQPVAPTNASGQATGTVRSTTAGTSMLTATDTTDTITVTQTASVTFTTGTVSAPGSLQLKQIAPGTNGDPVSASASYQTLNLANEVPGSFFIQSFQTQVGDPGAAVTIPAGSVFRILLYMDKSTAVSGSGVIYPKALLAVVTSSGLSTTFCIADDATNPGLAALSTTTTAVTLNCLNTSAVTFAPSDRLWLWTGVRLATSPTVNVSARLFVEGTTTSPPVFQSRLTIPWHETVAPAAVATLSAVDHPGDQGDGIDLTWSPNSTDGDLAGYTLYRSTTSGGPYTKVTPFPVSSTAYADRSLTPGVTYFYVVRAYDTSGNESPNSPQASATAIDNLAPLAVINFIAGDGADGQSPLAWTNPVDLALAEVLVRRKTGGYPTGHTDPTAVTAYQSTSPVSGAPVAITNFGLTNGTTYFFTVYSRDASGNWNDTTTPGGNADSAVPSSLAPLAPTGFAASDRPSDDGGAVVLTWTPSTAPGILEQRIYRSTTSGGPYSLAQTITGNTTQTAIDAGLTNGVTYFYVIRAYNGTRESGNSTQVSATPFDNLAPAAPSGLTATDTPNDQGGSVNLAWTPAPSADIIQQRVYRATTSGGPYTLIQTIAGRTTNALSDTTVTNGTTYFYVIRAFDGTQESGVSNEASAAPLDNLAPPAPLNLSAIDHHADNGQALDLSWTPSTASDVIQQRIYRSVAVGGPYVLVATITNNTTSAQTDTGLTNGTTYFYVVRAFDGTQESPDSGIASAIPSDNLLTNPPTGLSATDVPADRGGAIALTWTPSTSTDVTQQRVYRSTTSGGPYTLAATVAGTATGYTDTLLTNGTTYFYVVRAFDGTQEGPSSNQAAAAPADNSVFHLHFEFSTVTGGP